MAHNITHKLFFLDPRCYGDMLFSVSSSICKRSNFLDKRIVTWHPTAITHIKFFYWLLRVLQQARILENTSLLFRKFIVSNRIYNLLPTVHEGTILEINLSPFLYAASIPASSWKGTKFETNYHGIMNALQRLTNFVWYPEFITIFARIKHHTNLRSSLFQLLLFE